MSDYREFVESRLIAGEDAATIVRKISEALTCPVCPFCNLRPATLLCDFVIGFEWQGEMGDHYRTLVTQSGEPYAKPTGEQYRVISRDSVMFTCDRPMCGECATNKGYIHYIGKEGGTDSRDYCPQCRDTVEVGLRPLSRLEAINERAKMWARSTVRLTLMRKHEAARA